MKQFLIALVLTLLMAAGASAQTPRQGGSLIFAMESDASTLNPLCG